VAPAIAPSPGSVEADISSMTAAPSLPFSGSGALKSSLISAKRFSGRYGRDANERRKSYASATARFRMASYSSLQSTGSVPISFFIDAFARLLFIQKKIFGIIGSTWRMNNHQTREG
jgi:hypothetical protein